MTAALARDRLSHSLPRYLVIGGLSFAVDFAVLFVAHGLLSIWLPLAAATAYLCAFAVNFGLNRIWAFGSSAPVGRQLFRYTALVAFNTLPTVGIVSGLAALGLQYLAAKVVATALLTVLNYFAYRLWVFR